MKSDGKGGYYLPHGKGFIDKDGVFHAQLGCMEGVSECVLSWMSSKNHPKNHWLKVNHPFSIYVYVNIPSPRAWLL